MGILLTIQIFKNISAETIHLGTTSLLELPEEEFNLKLTQFLYSPSGSKYRFLFKYKDDIICGKSAPEVLVSKI